MNDETFKVGEVGILQGLKGYAQVFNGQEAEVIGGLEQRHVLTMQGTQEFAVSYMISYREIPVAIRPSNLKKKRPPRIEHAELRELSAVM